MTLAAAVRLVVVFVVSLVLNGAVDATAFGDLRRVPACPGPEPGERRGDEQLSGHKRAEVARAIGADGAKVRSLPSYSPHLNPIE